MPNAVEFIVVVVKEEIEAEVSDNSRVVEINDVV
jgi:hypothetical protein